MAMRLIAAVVFASAVLLVPQAAPAVELPESVTVPDSVQPGGGTTVTIPKVEVPKVLTPPSKDPPPGNEGGANGGGAGGTPAAGPGGTSPAGPDSPDQDRPAIGSPAKKAPAGHAPAAGAPGQAAGPEAGSGSASRAATGSGESSDSSSGASRAPRPGVPARDRAPVSPMERVFDQIPTGLPTALALISLLAAVLAIVWLHERFKFHRVKRRALRDPLTGIANRLAFEQQLAREWKRARRYQRPLGVMLLDVDGLKRVNDTEGHGAGDDLLRSVAQRIEGVIREPDLAARLAGDEFVVLCPETTMAGLQQLAEKLDEQLQRTGIRASIGCSEYRGYDTSPEDMVTRADDAMYHVKESRGGGRAAVTVPLSIATAT
jgi:diguanylate cyclase (GGDEF)-like protein